MPPVSMQIPLARNNISITAGCFSHSHTGTAHWFTCIKLTEPTISCDLHINQSSSYYVSGFSHFSDLYYLGKGLIGCVCEFLSWHELEVHEQGVAGHERPGFEVRRHGQVSERFLLFFFIHSGKAFLRWV